MSAFGSFKYRNFKLFFYGQSISLLGTWIQKTAVMWLVYRLTGSAMLLGITGFVSLIPSLILSPYTGSYVERHDKFKVMKQTQLLAMLQAGALAAVVFFHFYNISIIILLSLIQGVINAFDVTCRQAMMIELVDNKDNLPNAIALNSTMTNMARLVGPALAGVLLSTFGEDFCFISNFLSYIPIFICLYQMQINTKPFGKPEKQIWEELKQGLDYILSEKDILGLLGLCAASSLLVIPFTTLMPVFAKDVFRGSSSTFSLFESAVGLGSLMGAIYLARLKMIDNLVNAIVTASAVFSVGLLVVATANSQYQAVIGMVIAGGGMMIQTSGINMYIQTHAVAAMRSRAISYFVMAYLGITPVGSLLIGWLAEVMPSRYVVCLEAALGLLAVGGYLTYRHYLQNRKDVAGMVAGVEKTVL